MAQLTLVKNATHFSRGFISLWLTSLPLVKKGTLAVIDHGLISGSNFLISVLLARWMLPEQYGALALAFAVFLLLSLSYQALLLQPLGVFGLSVVLSYLVALATAQALLRRKAKSSTTVAG